MRMINSSDDTQADMDTGSREQYRRAMLRKADRMERAGWPRAQVEATRRLAELAITRDCNCGSGHNHDGSGYCGY